MNRWLKVLAIVAVVLVIGTYAIYSLEYKGNYNVDVTFKVNVQSEGEATITDLSVSSSETELAQFWQQFKGHGGGDASNRMYDIFVEFNQSGEVQTKVIYALMVPEQSRACEVSFENVPAGSASLRIYVIYVPIDSTIATKTYAMVVG